MDAYLLDITAAAALLGLKGTRAARRWLQEKGVPMVDYGPGRGYGPRWPRNRIIEAIEASLVYKAEQQAKRQKPAPRPISGRSNKELLREIASAQNMQ